MQNWFDLEVGVPEAAGFYFFFNNTYTPVLLFVVSL